MPANRAAVGSEGPPPASPPSAASATPRWGLGDAIAGFVLGTIVVVLATSIWAGINGNDDRSFGLLAVQQVALWSGLAGVPVWAAWRKGSGSLRRDFGLAARGADVPAGLGLGAVCQFAVGLLYLPFHVGKELERPARELRDLSHGASFAVLAVALVVGAPVVEELFFRGLLLRSLSRRFGDGWGLAGSSILFGLAHFEALQFPALVGVGLACGFLARRTGRLGPGIFLHAGFNGLAVAFLAR